MMHVMAKTSFKLPLNSSQFHRERSNPI